MGCRDVACSLLKNYDNVIDRKGNLGSVEKFGVEAV
jgi:hypothetical protein